MRPNLIPHTFIAKNMRKRYHRRCTERTWCQWLVDYQNALLFVVGLMFVLLILYIRYRDKANRTRAVKKTHPHTHTGTHHTNSDDYILHQPYTHTVFSKPMH